jgi:hypothetical protein
VVCFVSACGLLLVHHFCCVLTTSTFATCRRTLKLTSGSGRCFCRRRHDAVVPVLQYGQLMRPCSVRHVLVDMLCAALVCQVYRVQNKVSSAAHIAGQGRTRPAALGAQRGARQLHRQLASCQCNLDVDSGHAFILWWKQKTTTVLIGELQTNLASACRGKYLCCTRCRGY